MRLILETLAAGLLAVLIVLAFNTVVFAQNNRTKTFPLGKEMDENAIICLDKNIAVSLAKAVETGDEVERDILFYSVWRRGQCRKIAARIMYTAVVEQTKTAEGEPVAVYEARIGERTVYVPVIGWTHESF